MFPTDYKTDYKTLFEQSRVAITIVSENGTIIDVNDSFLGLIGYSRQELATMKAGALWLDGRDRQRWRDILIERGGLVDYESQQKTKDGRVLDLLLTTTVRADADGNRIFQTTIRDISDKKKVDRERDLLIEELKATLDQVRALEEFLPLCSHCRKIRKQGESPEKQENWLTLERYLQTYTSVQVSHSICPECLERFFPGQQ